MLNGLQVRLHHLPAADKLIHPALSAGTEAMKVLIAILFTLAAAAYWLFERDRAVDFVAGLVADHGARSCGTPGSSSTRSSARSSGARS